jgi:glucan biosynthesis protein C
MDALRAIAMLLGIVLHVTIAYRLTSSFPWPADDKVHSIFYDYLYLFLHSFRMQLFFLIAGFFARLLYLKIGLRSFVRHRLRRIMLPLVVGIVTVVPLSMMPFFYYRYWYLHPGKGFFEIVENIVPHLFRWNGLVHLWFLYYLIFYYVTMLALILIDKKVGILKRMISFIYRKVLIFPRMQSLFLLIVPVTLALCLFPTLPVEPYTGLFPHMPLYMYYGFFFFLGFTFHRHYRDNLQAFTKNAIPFLIIGTAMVPIVWKLCYLPDGENVLPWFIMVRLIAATQTIFLLFGFMGVFLKFAKAESYTLRYISDASYWMYLVHVPIVVSMQIWFIDSIVPPFLRFAIINVAAIGISLLTYMIFVRYTIIGKVLNGPRKRRSAKKTDFALGVLPALEARTSH